MKLINMNMKNLTYILSRLIPFFGELTHFSNSLDYQHGIAHNNMARLSIKNPHALKPIVHLYSTRLQQAINQMIIIKCHTMITWASHNMQ